MASGSELSDNAAVMPYKFPWKSPMANWKGSRNPLPEGYNPDGKSLVNDTTSQQLSKTYAEFPDPIDKRNNGFDFHIYYMQTDQEEVNFARDLHERIRREFPELRIYRLWDKPVGPHPVAMFEVNTFNPHQTGALFGFLAVYRGPLSVLIHPNTGESVKDHTDLATWMGKQWPLNVDFLKRFA